ADLQREDTESRYFAVTWLFVLDRLGDESSALPSQLGAILKECWGGTPKALPKFEDAIEASQSKWDRYVLSLTSTGDIASWLRLQLKVDTMRLLWKRISSTLDAVQQRQLMEWYGQVDPKLIGKELSGLPQKG